MIKIPLKDLFCLNGKVAIVTGCKSLGYDAAEALAELGATVVLTRRSMNEAQESAQRLKQDTNCMTYGVALEAALEDSWRETIDYVIEKFGKIDILINNAGGRRPALVNSDLSKDITLDFLENRDLKDWEYTISTNLTSVFLGCKTVIPYMKKAGSGKIINIASIDGMLGRDLRIYKGSGLSPTVADYLAGKAGVINLTKAMAVAYAEFGINVNSISPGGFFRGQPEQFVKNYEKNVPMGRMGKDRVDIKGATAYLATAASDYVTGHNLVIDGGMTAW